MLGQATQEDSGGDNDGGDRDRVMDLGSPFMAQLLGRIAVPAMTVDVVRLVWCHLALGTM